MHLWDVATGREIAELDTREIVHSATFSPDGSRIATASLAGQVLIWDVASRRQVARLNILSGLLQIQFSPEGRPPGGGFGSRHRPVVGRGDWRRSRHHPDKWDVAAGCFQPGRRSRPRRDQRQRGAPVETRRDRTEELVGHQSRITAAAFSPDGQLVATASLDRTARIWSVKDGSTVATLKGHSDELTTVAFSPDGQSC